MDGDGGFGIQAVSHIAPCYEIRQIITDSAHSDLFRRAPPTLIWEHPRCASVFRFVSSRKYDILSSQLISEGCRRQL